MTTETDRTPTAPAEAPIKGVGCGELVRRIGLVPIWLLTLALKPALPQTHPWKHQPMTLQSWWDRGTDNAVAFGWVFIVNGACIIALLLPRLFA